MTNTTRIRPSAKNPSATNGRNFRTFLLMQQFAEAEIGARIAQARHEANGMTQEQLAELLNVSTRSVQAYEAGETMPWKYFRLLESIFKRPMGWFLHGDPETSTESAEEVVVRLDRIEQVLEELVARLEPNDQEGRAGADPE